ncbi:MAG: hypothetical protein M1827_003224 [Pycnora praestabilis]|nr:MAG: hypothetical protein M1827_003224 [Pycnora praestabilis]
MISMERDWVPILSSPASDPSLPVYDLTHLNAVMRRIDLICQLLAPVVISVIISTTSSVRIGIIVVAATNSLSCGLEWWSLRRVWNEHGRLRQPKASNEQSTGLQDSTAQTSQPLWNLPGSVERTSSNTVTWIQDQAKSVQQYFLSDVWMPSISLSLLHLSVLSYSATFVTYLLSVGFSLNLITVARAIGSIVEISSTLVTPWGVHYLSSTPRNPQNHMAGFVDEEAEEVLLQLDEEQQPRHGPAGLERFGLWGISWQLLNLAPVVLALWQVSPQPSVSGASKAPPSITLLPRVLALTSPLNIQPAETLSLFFFLSASRLGLWIFDLTTQQLTQTRIPPVRRSSFAGTEMSFVSLFELGQWIAAAVFHKPEQFRWLALGSFGAVVVSTALYSFWVWRQRGHLFHWEKIGKSCDCIKGRTN